MNNVGPSYCSPVASGKFAIPSWKQRSSVSKLSRQRKSPLSDFDRLVIRKSRRDFSSMIRERSSSATFRAWWIVRLLGSLIERIAFRKSGMSVLFVPIGETGEISTTINLSTSSGCLNAKCIIVRPPIECPRTAAFRKLRSLRNLAISSDIEGYVCSVVCGDSPWFLASILMIFLGGFVFCAKALHKLFLKQMKLCNCFSFDSTFVLKIQRSSINYQLLLDPKRPCITIKGLAVGSLLWYSVLARATPFDWFLIKFHDDLLMLLMTTVLETVGNISKLFNHRYALAFTRAKKKLLWTFRCKQRVGKFRNQFAIQATNRQSLRDLAYFFVFCIYSAVIVSEAMDVEKFIVKEVPKTCYYIPNFITEAEEALIIHQIERTPLAK